MQELFKKYLDNQCSAEEVRLLLEEFDAGQNEELLRKLINEQLESEQEEVLVTGTERDNVLASVYKNVKNEIASGKKLQPIPVIPMYKQRWFRVAAAAVLILITGVTYLLLNKTNNEQPIAGNQKPVVNDIAPGGNKAVLTLTDGSTIILDNAANGTLTQQGNTKVIKLDNGQLAYNTLNETPAEVVYNSISTPRGGQYQLVLSDGSKVWLNAASSLRYPANFVGNERKVELTGEGYFEVAKNTSMPFKVDVAGKAEVEVLGTHFNINSYSDEATINTTLLEGRVKVNASGNQQLLSPGEQAQLNSNGKITLNNNTDPEEVMAWKNGKFNFNGQDIESIMRQIGRWYDVEVSYEGKMNHETYSGIVSRNSNISQVLRIMETGGVKFNIEEKKIIVRQ